MSYTTTNLWLHVFRSSTSGEKPELKQKNFQRKWPTSECKTETEALQAVLRFIFVRWNEENPTKKVEMFLGLLCMFFNSGPGVKIFEWV
jgi:hypothetical protein